MRDEEDVELSALVESGAEIGGATLGTALGFLVGGPPGAYAGAAGGAAAASVLKRSALEVKRRWLSSRESSRVGGLVGLAAEAIQSRLLTGEALRDDGFFEGGEDSDAAEIVEQTILAAKDEPEAKKLAILARLLAGIVFDRTVSREQAHVLLKAAESMSYRQLNLLVLFASENHLSGARETDYHDEPSQSGELIALLDELFELIRRGALRNGTRATLSPVDIRPSELRTQGIGAAIHNLAKLPEIYDVDAGLRAFVLISDRVNPATATQELNQ